MFQAIFDQKTTWYDLKLDYFDRNLSLNIENHKSLPKIGEPMTKVGCTLINLIQFD